MELLTLPEPAATLWRRAGPALERALAQTERPPARWSIGGGTILACRWGHRGSTDIDLTVPAGTGIDRLDERVGGTLRADMTAAGAADVSTGRMRHRIVFREGSIDIAELDPRPAAGHAAALIEGREVGVKSTTQILRGKLGPGPVRRRGRAPRGPRRARAGREHARRGRDPPSQDAPADQRTPPRA